jgi:hypothetical protein
MRLVKQTFLYIKEGNSDKVYEIDLCDVGNGNYHFALLIQLNTKKRCLYSTSKIILALLNKYLWINMNLQ